MQTFSQKLGDEGNYFMRGWVAVCLILQCNNTWFTRAKIKLL